MASLDVTTAWLVSAARLGRGRTAHYPVPRQPERPLELYEFEGCPFCRRVREYLSEADLDVIVRPCPKGGRERETVKRLGGKLQFPFLVDPNTGKQLYESLDIIRYLADTYGDGRHRTHFGVLAPLPVGFFAAMRSHGVRARPSSLPAQLLELYSFEASPFCRIVRERLCELSLPYRLHNVAKKSPRRDAFVAISGRMQVPYLIDPNTDTKMFESADIVAYLERYAVRI